jgi:glycosyltransferase involved in cell wall biosynthesis
MQPYLIVASDFVPSGGMEKANHALARHLADRTPELHLVGYSASSDVVARPNVFFHRVPKVANSYFLSGPLLDRAGRRWAARISRRGGRVLVNGGNCLWGDVNWVHYVHAAYSPTVAGPVLWRLKWKCAHRVFRADERKSLRKARVVIANSNATKRDLVDTLHIAADRIHTVYLGIDRDQFRVPADQERIDARRTMGWPADAPLILFIGALGDRRKGFDTVFDAWRILCSVREWDAGLFVLGAGHELTLWQERAASEGLQSRMRFLGFRKDVHRVLAAADALVSPTRYESYGLGVQEALCCGVPAFVTRTAGIAERYPAGLGQLLLPDPDDAHELAARLRVWRTQLPEYAAETRRFAESLREYTWDDMAKRMVAVIEAAR